MNSNKLVTLATFNDSIQAHLARTKLESEGILSFLYDENIVSVNPMYNVGVGGIKLKIKIEDYNQAVDILNNIESIPITDDQNQLVICPNCGSSNLYTNFNSIKSIKGIIGFIISILTSTLPIFTSKVNKCKDCNFEFMR